MRSKPAPLQLGSKGLFTLGTIQLHNLQLAAIILSSQVISLILRRPRSLFVVPSANNLRRLRIRLPSDIRKEGIELKWCIKGEKLFPIPVISFQAPEACDSHTLTKWTTSLTENHCINLVLLLEWKNLAATTTTKKFSLLALFVNIGTCKSFTDLECALHGFKSTPNPHLNPYSPSYLIKIKN